MLTIFDSIRRVINRERPLLSRYERSHRHFFWYAVLDAAVSVALVVGGFQVAHAGSSWKVSVTTLQLSGVRALSADQVINLAHGRQLEVFWLGRISGAAYSFEVKPGEGSTLTYLRNLHRRMQEYNHAKLIIQNYDSYETFNANLHPILGADPDGNVESPNFTLRYDSSMMKTATIIYKHSPQVVVIHYPVSHSISSMTNDAESLALI
jgi:hypothetical protein